MIYETIAYDFADAIVTLTLNVPDRLNAFTPKMAAELIHAFDSIDADDDVRAVIVTGAGRAFCAGADLSQGAESFDQGGASIWRSQTSPFREDGSVDYASEGLRDQGGLVTLRIFECLKPVIGAVNGPAVGIGATLLLPMDIRVASESAKFGFVFTKRGVVPEAASSWFLPRIVPIDAALEWCFTGRIFDAEEARDGGLVRRVVRSEDLAATARGLAAEIVENTAPVSVALVRQMMWRMTSASHPMTAHRLDSRLMFDRGRSGDAREGVASFLEKRRPHYPDRVSSDMPASYPWWPDQEGDWTIEPEPRAAT